MKFDNERDRYSNGFDAGQIVSGKVSRNPETGHFVIIDDEGVGFDPQAALESLEGQEIRMTMTTVKAMIEMQKMLEMAQERDKSN